MAGSTRRGLGKPAKNRKNERSAVEIERLNVARGLVDPVPHLRERREPLQVLGFSVQFARQPFAHALDEHVERLRLGSVEKIGERMQRARIG